MLLSGYASGDQNRKTAHNQAARRTFAHSHIGPKPIPPCSPSRLVALSRCPDASDILASPEPGENGTKVWLGNQPRSFGHDLADANQAPAHRWHTTICSKPEGDGLSADRQSADCSIPAPVSPENFLHTTGTHVALTMWFLVRTGTSSCSPQARFWTVSEWSKAPKNWAPRLLPNWRGSVVQSCTEFTADYPPQTRCRLELHRNLSDLVRRGVLRVGHSAQFPHDYTDAPFLHICNCRGIEFPKHTPRYI